MGGLDVLVNNAGLTRDGLAVRMKDEDWSIVQQVNVTGSVTSPRTAVLSTAVAGLVADIVVDEGQRVATGDAMLSHTIVEAKSELEKMREQVQNVE